MGGAAEATPKHEKELIPAVFQAQGRAGATKCGACGALKGPYGMCLVPKHSKMVPQVVRAGRWGTTGGQWGTQGSNGVSPPMPSGVCGMVSHKAIKVLL